jgi:hypothetical protein
MPCVIYFIDEIQFISKYQNKTKNKMRKQILLAVPRGIYG